MSKGGRRSTTWSPAWNLGKTKVIRIPEAIADELMEIARHLDNGNKCLLQGKNENNNSHVTDDKTLIQIKEILEKIENKEPGFKSNSFGQGIKKLKEITKCIGSET